MVKKHLVSKGFTLLELAVSISIMALFAGLSLAYYNNLTEGRKLRGEAKQLVDVLNLASKKANSADITPNPGCSSFEGYRVNITSATNSYSLQFVCSSGTTPVQSYTAVSPITINPTVAITFKPLSRGTDMSPTITVRNPNISKCIQIIVSSFGVVTENAITPC